MSDSRRIADDGRAPDENTLAEADHPEFWYALAALIIAGCGLLGIRSTRYFDGHPARKAVGGCLITILALCSWILGVHVLIATSDHLAERRRM